MWKSMYTLLTTYKGVYVFYLTPIVYCSMIALKVMSSRYARDKRLGIPDGVTIAAIGLIALDFMYYLYVLLTGTGKLLPPLPLLFKYTLGFFLWLWVAGYCYTHYLAPHAAGEQFKARCTSLVWIGIGSLGLACIGILVS